MSPPAPFHVSQNRLEGSLCDTSIERLLESCRQHLITGTITVTTQFIDGVIELRAGAVEQASMGDTSGDAALRKLRRLGDGMYELTQRLPDLTGQLGESARSEGTLEEVPLITIMQLCENQALSCTITLVRDFDRVEIRYRAGEIEQVTLNGQPDDDVIVAVVSWTSGRFRISAPPLALDIDGWPSAKDPTVPFKISDAARMMPPRPASRTGGLPGVGGPAPTAAASARAAATPAAKSTAAKSTATPAKSTATAAKSTPATATPAKSTPATATPATATPAASRAPRRKPPTPRRLVARPAEPAAFSNDLPAVSGSLSSAPPAPPRPVSRPAPVASSLARRLSSSLPDLPMRTEPMLAGDSSASSEWRPSTVALMVLGLLVIGGWVAALLYLQ